MTATKKSTLAGIFCLGLSVILFEIALTRVFAIMMWHHFTYMVISIGLLGFGASGSLLTATRLGATERAADRALVWTSLGYGVSVVLAFCFATLVRIDSLAVWEQKQNFLALFFVYLIIFVPFLLGGLGIGLALTRHVQSVNRLYFADLVGSACGAGLSVLLMKWYGSSATVVLAGSFGLLAAFCFGLGVGWRYLLLTVPGLALAGWLGIGFAGGAPALGVPAMDWRVPFAPGKEALVAEVLLREAEQRGALAGQRAELERIYSATAEVQVGPSIPSPPMIGGDQGRVDQRLIEARGVAQDGTAPTMLFKDAAKLDSFPFLDDTQAATAYVVHRAAGKKDQQVMVIGVGGGVDVMVALANGAKHVTAVELNTAMIEMVTERHRDYLGGLFDEPGPFADRIELVNSEGRAWLRSHDAKYDVIQMSGVDSYTALSTGAYTLSESYLYTVEAVADFWSHLNPDGVVTWSRFIESAPKKSRETLRLANIAVSSLRGLGVADPAAHVCVFQGLGWASTMLKQSPFTAAEVQALRDFARRQGFVGLIFDPLQSPAAVGEPEPTWFAGQRVGMLPQVAALPGVGADPAAVEAAWDALAALAPAVAKGQPVTAEQLPPALQAPATAAAALQLRAGQRASFAAQVEYLAATRRDFATLLRGDDAARAAFLAGYEFDVSPSTDDRPFFFNYYRWSALADRVTAWFGGGSRTQQDTLFNYHTDFPVGHLVLLGSMAQILLLAALLIFLPLRKLERDGARRPGATRFFLYFAALGLGFMLIEIALMQKLVIFLGHPTYALSLVLVSLLASAGLGSLLAGRIAVVGRRHLLWILLAIVAVVLLDVLAVNHLLPLLLGAPLWARMLVVVLLLVPTGLALGMPFPTGMRAVEARCPQLVPWGWAVNAFFSVFGSIFCIVLSMAIGFSNVFYVALGVYVVGMLGMATLRALPAAPGAADAAAAARPALGAAAGAGDPS
ncbi:MAG: spermidine synthase [Planctomycetota bacterium]